MRRFYLPPEALKTPEPIISGPDANHIKNVLRLKPGQTIVVFDGRGNAHEAVINAISADGVAISPGPAMPPAPDRSVKITLAQALLKSGKMDTLVRQITELGIARWAPFIAERSVSSPDPRRADKKRARWETIAREALKQCRRNRMPEIGGVVGFDDILKLTADTDLSLIFYEAEKAPIDLLSLRESMPRPETLLIIVGPEGGFTESEMEQARAFNIPCGSLGPRILRAETAALAAAALVQFLFGDMRQKTP